MYIVTHIKLEIQETIQKDHISDYIGDRTQICINQTMLVI